MVREAYALAQALSAAGIEVDTRNAAVTSPGAAAGVLARVLLDSNGQVKAVLPVPKGEEGAIWCLRKGNFHFWPVIRPTKPLLGDNAKDYATSVHDQLRLAAKQKIRGRKEEIIRDAVKRISEYSIDPTGLTGAESSARRGQEAAGRLTRLINGEPKIAELTRRIEAFLASASIEVPNILSSVLEDAFGNLSFQLAYGELDQNGKPSVLGQLAFDLLEQTIYTPTLRAKVESVLATDAEEKQKGLLRCSLSEANDVPYVGPFPSPSLPVIGKKGVPLFSMFKDAEANRRYGRTGTEIVCIGRKAVQRSLDALAYVTEDKRIGKHWRPVANGKLSGRTELQDLMIVFAEGLPPDLCDTDPFGEPGPEEPLRRDEVYEAALGKVLDAMDGIAASNPAAKVHLHLLRQVSDGQVQAVYSRVPKMRDVVDAGRHWTGAQKQRPKLLIEWVGKTGERRTISPVRMVRLLSTQFSQDGQHDARVQAPSLGETIDFMLSTEDERQRHGARLLSLAVTRGWGLIVGVAGEIRHQNAETKASADKAKPKDAASDDERKTLSRPGQADRYGYLLALLLDAIERPMDPINKPPAYLLGLMLGITDTLHAAYGVVVRNSVPTTLAGNSLLGIAKDNPERALAELLERIGPWQSWAEKVDYPKKEDNSHEAWEIRKASSSLKRYAFVCPELSGRLPKTMTDADRAELLLGYLSKDQVADALSNDDATARSTNPTNDDSGSNL